MKKINLRELYPDVYPTDFFIDVTEEVMETIRAAERAEAAYERKMYRYKAQYSLDCENGCVYFTSAGLQEYIAKCTHRAKPAEMNATYRKPRRAGV